MNLLHRLSYSWATYQRPNDAGDAPLAHGQVSPSKDPMKRANRIRTEPNRYLDDLKWDDTGSLR